jgi:hypothetical protein
MGFEVVAVNLLELAVSPGLEVIRALGGLGPFTSWRGRLVAQLLGDRPETPARGSPVGATGWRARRLPVIVREDDGEMELRSPVDGSTWRLNAADLWAAARELGAATLDGESASWWRTHREPPPAGGTVVSSVPAQAAREGLYLTPGGWLEVAARADDARGPLVEGCACRACAIAHAGYLAHLWRQREITAAHLLGWHNLHQARLLVEG